MKKTVSLLLAAALALTLAGCGAKEVEVEEEDAGVAVRVAEITADTIATENTVVGRLSAENTETIMVASAAKCEAVYKEAGDTVEEGEKIAKLDLGSTIASYRAAKVGYDSAVQAYNDQKSILGKQVKLAEDNVANTKALFAIGAASQLEVDNAQITYETALAGMNSALGQLESGIQNAKSGLAQLGVVMDNVDLDGNIIAPISGTVTSLGVAVGGFASASMPVAVITGAEQMKITTSVSEALIPQLAAGQVADVYVSSTDQTFAATIRSVERSANYQTQLYAVTLTVPAEVTGLVSGATAQVTFHTNVSENAVVIPTEAILTGTEGAYVFVAENGVAHRRDITTGLAGSGVTEVLSGLAVGEELVTVGQAYLVDGSIVRIIEGATV